MGDLRKQIRHLEAQVQGFLSVVRDFNQRLKALEEKMEKLDGFLRRLAEVEITGDPRQALTLSVYAQKVAREVLGMKEKKLEGK